MKLEEMIKPTHRCAKKGLIPCHKPWIPEELGRFDAFIDEEAVKELEEYNHIKEVTGITDARQIQIGISVFFDNSNTIRDLEMFLSEHFPKAEEDESEWSEYRPIGDKVVDRFDNIVGHTMLSVQEFSHLIDIATKKTRGMKEETDPDKENDRDDI